MDFFTLVGLTYSLYISVYLVVLVVADCDLHLFWKEKFGNSPDCLKGNVVWVTGASSGIGKSLAIRLASYGCKLVLSARNRDELLRVRERCLEAGEKSGLEAGDVLVLRMDMLEIPKHEECFQRVIDHFGHLDILVNNAGRSQRAVWESIELPVDRQVFELNVFSVVALSRLAVRHFIERGSGHLAVTSSIAGIVGAPFSGSYTGSKHAIHGYMDGLRSEKVAHPELKITLLCPGPVFTNFLQESFTAKDGESFGENASETDNRMSADRCAYLCSVALANNLHEAWIAQFPIVPLTYLLRYFPNVAWCVVYLLGGKRLQHLRDSRDTVEPISSMNSHHED